jgi:heat shock 70kDa protein 4
MDEIRAVAGPIVQRYFDKLEQERAAAAAAEAELAAKRAATEEAKKAAGKDSKAENGTKDEEMTDAETVKPDEVDEAK